MPVTTLASLGSPARRAAAAARRAEQDDRNARSVALLTEALDAPEAERRRIQQRVVVDYLDVADAVASRYLARSQDAGDLRQVAYLGLTKAIQRFEPTRGADIVSFAVPTIAGEIKRYLRDTSWLVRPPRHLQELHSELRTTIPGIAQRLGHEPSAAEIAQETGFSVDDIVQALDCGQSRQPASLDAPHGIAADGLGTLTLGDTLRATGTEFARAEVAAALADACRTLSPRDRRILYLRFVHEQSQAEIARECGVTQMQISRLLTKILATLRGRLTPDLLAA
ncbi:SigB/SigF/SigG family RNA polymerase sigma factor [Microbacterium oryzae]|uniref:Sigma-70 family RNA polymerase sigma factor n=1 Tax=Microbacterium oryzae TaxID=743009 RepID=A0A6I6E5Y9_9MICO|nr:sigma-70 family RNA polymerase sigma factor [Microbacterium oryzae]QGU26728.1 sigma-70 family RNA polymerase sigma factor [Microbacterium oryzae]